MCAEYHMFHSEFLARSASDRDKSIWWHVRKRQACPSCGTRPEEWDPDKGGYRHAYRAEALQCDGCQRRERAEQDLARSKNPPPGMHVVLVKNEEA